MNRPFVADGFIHSVRGVPTRHAFRSRTIATLLTTCLTLLASGELAWGGMRIDLRPDGLTTIPGNPPSVTAMPGTYNVDVYYVDTDNPNMGNIAFRALFLDSADTTGLVLGQGMIWACGGFCDPVPFPNTSWVYPLPTPNPFFQITIPDGGEVFAGNFDVTVDADGGLLDLMNADNPDANFGARADFGFGGPGDPFTTWRAFTGEITGGRLAINVPEPTSLLLLMIGASVAMRAGCGRGVSSPLKKSGGLGEEVWDGFPTRR